jgi:hypothetical protein
MLSDGRGDGRPAFSDRIRRYITMDMDSHKAKRPQSLLLSMFIWMISIDIDIWEFHIFNLNLI